MSNKLEPELTPQEQFLVDDVYTTACRLLAIAYSFHRRVDTANYPELKNTTLYDYLHEAIDFDQLCEDVASHLEDIVKAH